VGGLLDLYAKTAGTTDTPLQALPSTLGERVAATADETFAPDRYFTINRSRRDLWQRAADDLQRVTGEALPNPYDPPTHDEMMRLFNEPAVQDERRNRLIEASRMARAQGNDDLFDPENIDRYIGEEANRRRGRARDLEGTGYGFLNFLAAAGLETATPHGLVGLFVPVTRLPGAAGVARSFLGNVVREGAFQAGANAALQAGAEGLDFLSRSQTGSAQTGEEIAANIAGAAVIGGGLGAGLRALHLKWLGLPEKVRADAPLEVKDAFRAIEGDVLYSGKNRLGVDALLHERFVEQSMDPILRGRAPDFSSLARSVDTPFTALGTVLRTVPDEVSVRGLEGLGTAMDRVRALPDRELESFAREIAPRPFERLDGVQAEIAQVRAQLADLNSRTPSAADLLDPDTAMRLREIETDLSAPALSRRDRQALEDEREMIMASVDPKDRLPKQAEKAQRAEAGALEKQIAKLEEKRDELAPKAEKAVADLRRKLDRYAFAPGFEWAGRPDQPWTGPRVAKDLGFTAPADLDAAIQRAEFERQVRMLREVVPESPRTAPAEPMAAPPKEIAPEAQKALDTEVARLVAASPDLRVEINGRTMSAADALADADRMAKDAQAALGCAMGSL
jgi:hypothetical protein